MPITVQAPDWAQAYITWDKFKAWIDGDNNALDNITDAIIGRAEYKNETPLTFVVYLAKSTDEIR